MNTGFVKVNGILFCMTLNVNVFISVTTLSLRNITLVLPKQVEAILIFTARNVVILRASNEQIFICMR